MAMLPYERFYRNHGVRQAAQLANPPVSIYNELTLPRNSVFHWFGYDHSEKVGLDQTDVIAKGVDRFIFAENIEQYQQEDIVGSPRNLPLITTSMTRQYFSDNKKIKRLKMPLKDVRDERSLVVYNYGLLNDKYIYTGALTKELDRWLNYHRTVYKTIARLTKESDRHHFVEIDVPVMVPPVTALITAENGLDSTSLRRLSTPDDWQVSEIFNLLTSGYNAYIFRDLVDDMSVMNKINLIFKSGHEFTVMNLGTLFGFAGVSFNKDEEYDSDGSENVRLRIAKRYLSSQIHMRKGMTLDNISDAEERKPLADELSGIVNEDDRQGDDSEDDISRNARVNAPLNKREQEIKQAEKDKAEEIDLDTSANTAYDPFNPNASKNKPKQVSRAEQRKQKEIDDAIDEEERLDKEVDEELAELEQIDFGFKSDGVDTYEAYVPPSRKGQDRIEARAREFAEVGLMTPAEINRIKKIAGKVNDIDDPRDKTKKLIKSSKITPEELIVDEGMELISDKVVGLTDKSMSHSTLNKFDKEYINNTLNKDVAKMMLSLQQAGIMILDYKVERVKDYVNDYEIHRIKVQPVGGKESTISFKLPKITEEGTFTAGGTTRKMRKQRSDVPIRKVAPDEVALTSYYSKLFITRTPRKQFNYTMWIGNEVVAASIDSDTPIMSDIKLNNSYDQYISVPSAYSGIAMRVSSLKARDTQFYFDVRKIEENLGVKYKPNDKKIAVGVNKKGVVMMDDYGVLHQGSTPLGTIEEYLGLDIYKRPIDFVEVKIFSKAVPIVLVMAYQIGLGNLIKTLGCRMKRMPPRKHYTLEAFEYVINFRDEKLIFDRRDRKATLILSGLRRFGRTLQEHSVYELDKRNVYNNLMDSIKVPLRYLKEIPLMFDMWVDHITEEILIDMGEPTDLMNLFIRACELLMDDSHPDANDMAYMRDKGYERLSGMVYNELVTSLRKYSNKPINKNTSFELHPEAVWYTVLQDESVINSETSNPIHALKEQEIVVYRGEGGRSALSMTAKDRRFHENALGVTSEATVDNSDVGTVVYTTFNPNYKNVRGMTDRVDPKNLKPSELISTSMMLSPGAENEDRYNCPLFG